MSDEMTETWLVQRLQKPFRGQHPILRDNPFAFGGGLKNGGLSDDAMDLLRDIWQFDYMGAAEFEFGAVPSALSTIARADDLIAFTFKIPLAEVSSRGNQEVVDGSADLFVICASDHATEVERRIREWAELGYRARMKEYTRLPEALRPSEKWDRDTCGWLELDNGFLFFADREMWEGACRLFGVQNAEPAAVSPADTTEGTA